MSEAYDKEGLLSPREVQEKQLQQPKEQGALLCAFFDVISSFFCLFQKV